MALTPGDASLANGTMAKAVYDAMTAALGAPSAPMFATQRANLAAAIAQGVCAHIQVAAAIALDNPPSIAAGASYLSAGVTITGAALGQHVVATCSVDLQGLQLSAYVSAANTVRFLLVNSGVSPVDLVSATFYLQVNR